jgi:hypothetical protein
VVLYSSCVEAFLAVGVRMSAVAYGRNARLGGGVSPSPFEVLRGFFRMSSGVLKYWLQLNLHFGWWGVWLHRCFIRCGVERSFGVLKCWSREPS